MLESENKYDITLVCYTLVGYSIKDTKGLNNILYGKKQT